MEKTQVTIETFKESGKWYDIIKFETETPPHDTNKLIEECKSRAQSGMSFIFEAESQAGGLNKRLILIPSEQDMVIIESKIGALIITPKEVKGFQHFGIDLKHLLEKVQKFVCNNKYTI